VPALVTRASHPARAGSLALLGCALAVAGGALCAWNPLIGIALVLAGAYAAIALRSLQYALTAWVPSFFISFFPAGNAWLKGGLLVVLLALARAIATDRGLVTRVLRRHSRPLGLLGAVLVWFAVTAVWAETPRSAFSEWLKLLLCGTLFVVVLVAVREAKHVLWIVVAFVGAGVYSAILGLLGVSYGLSNPDAAAEVAQEGRITAWAGDPNVLAASLVATTVLALVLAGRTRGGWRLACFVGAGLSLVGVAATQSRGGLVAAIVALVAGVWLFRRKPAKIVPLAVAIVVGLGLYFAAFPSASHRITESGDAGSGRTELWTVALRSFRQHPVQGIGLNQFRQESGKFVLQPGTLRFVELISERPVVVHNTYLQYLAETGLVGFGLFAALLVTSLRSYQLAIRRFDALGLEKEGLMARGLLVSILGVLAAGFFVSAGVDYKTWLLLALGPAMLGVARASSPARRSRLA
jgi:O-antigen ligase